MNKLFYIPITCLFLSCSHYSTEIEEVLQQAGSNRAELEKVLKYYGKSPADSLKLRAAEFLIVNMPGKYSKYYDAPWNDVATALLRWTSSSDKQMVLDAYSLGKPVIKEDVKHITADYLINNIELAFKVWREQPWGKHISFEIFCEEILPYRLDVEPLENWREKALASFAGLDNLLKKPDMTAVQACKLVNDALPRFRIDKDFPAMNFSQLMASVRGTCNALAALSVFSMRALGIPVTFDYTNFYPNGDVGHAWNAVCDSAGRHISFMGTETNPGEPHQVTILKENKIFRKTFARRTNIHAPQENIPPALRGLDGKDVSSEYDGFFDVSIPLTSPPPDSSRYAYLEGKGLKTPWHIVSWGVTDGTSIRYASVGKQVLYRPVWYHNGSVKPAGDMFALDRDGKIFSVTNERKPFKGPHILSAAAPCIIPMRDFDMGGEGVAFHESDDSNSNQPEGDDYRRDHGDVNSYSVDVDKRIDIGWTVSGEWLLYTVEVRDAGMYRWSVSVSAIEERTFHLEVDDQDVSGAVSVPPTGGWHNWVWCPGKPLRVHLTAGTHQLKCYMESDGCNFHEMKLEYDKMNNKTILK